MSDELHDARLVFGGLKCALSFAETKSDLDDFLKQNSGVISKLGGMHLGAYKEFIKLLDGERQRYQTVEINKTHRKIERGETDMAFVQKKDSGPLWATRKAAGSKLQDFDGFVEFSDEAIRAIATAYKSDKGVPGMKLKVWKNQTQKGDVYLRVIAVSMDLTSDDWYMKGKAREAAKSQQSEGPEVDDEIPF